MASREFHTAVRAAMRPTSIAEDPGQWRARKGAPSRPLTVAVGCKFQFALDEATACVALVEPHISVGDALVNVEWDPEPSERYLDLYGNVCRRLPLPAGLPSFEYNALVTVADDPDEVPDERDLQAPPEELPARTLHWLLPSRYCESDALEKQARELFGTTAPDGTRVQAICDWIHESIEYGVPSTPTTTATDVFNRGGGMCRDFAHLGVTFCRALNIPARYVCGYIPDIAVSGPQPPQDFHAWFEAFLGGRWWTFDARFNVPRVGRIPIGRGRDAADVAMVTTFGAARLEEMVVWADVAEEV